VLAWQADLEGSAVCDGRQCWDGSGTPVTRWRYRDRNAHNAGVSDFAVSTGRPGRDKTKLKAGGSGFFLLESPEVSVFDAAEGVELTISAPRTGACWSFRAAPDTVLKHTSRAFLARKR
jgi:hypothetical protein